MENMQTTTKEATWDEFLELIDVKKEKPAAAPKKAKKTTTSKNKK
jgi:hypothetical protein